MNKTLTNSLLIALMAGIVALHSCNKDKLTPEQDGKNLAKELCDCFTQATTDDAKLACISNFENKRNKWRDSADVIAFQIAFDEAIQTCGSDPYQWLLSRLAIIAVAEFCALATQHPEGGDMMILAPLYMKYEAELNGGNPAFLEPFFQGLMACLPYSAWILCTFRITEFCTEEELTEEELIALATTAVSEFCDYFTANPDADLDSMMASELAKKYGNHFTKPVFINTLLQGLATCSNAPQWFFCTMSGNQWPGC
jgi:hypothetical protein